MTPGFTSEQQRSIGGYVRDLADAMGLRDWMILLAFDPPVIRGAIASIRLTYGRKVATIAFERDFATRTPGDIRHTVVHELVHVIEDPVTSVLQNAGPDLLGKIAFLPLWEATRERAELATDQLADVIAPFMPLIDWTVTEEADRIEWTDKMPDQIDMPPGEPDPDELV